MQRYTLQEAIGEGTFGTVFRAIRKESGEKVAIKRMKQKFSQWSETFDHREVQAIQALSDQSCCSHLVRIHEIIREDDSTLYFVCEYMPDGTLNDFVTKTLERGDRIESTLITSILRQVLHGLEHMHSKGYMHRDLKPENLLLRGRECKVADFSLSRSTSNFNDKKMTSYVSTRWYRAPEIILCAPRYSTAVDLFALGCIMAELYRMCPLFPGSSEVEQLRLLLDLLGPMQEWQEGIELSKRFGLEIESASSQLSVRGRLEKKVSTAGSSGISLLVQLLDLNPDRRPSTKDALAHDYFCKETSRSHKENISEPTNTVLATTPPNQSTSHSNGSGSRAPFVSISPSMRNNVTKRTSDGGLLLPIFKGGTASTCHQSPYCQTPTGVGCIKPESDSWGSTVLKGQKRKRSEYRPARAFKIDRLG